MPSRILITAFGYLLGLLVCSPSAMNLAAAGTTTPASLPPQLRVQLDPTRLAIPSPEIITAERDDDNELPLLRALPVDLDDGHLFEAALSASGVESAGDRKRYQKLFQEWCRSLQATCAKLHGDRAAAQAVLEFLHHGILTGRYELDCSALTLAIDSGNFNCVSATILFNCLAHAQGLNVSAAERPGHVLSVVHLEKETLHVETTSAAWFEILDDPSRLRQYVPPDGASAGAGARRAFRELKSAGLIALLYYNRGVDEMQAGNYPSAVALNYAAFRLDPASVTARGNMLAGINNWSLDLAQQRRYQAAAALLESGRELAPEHTPFKANSQVVYRQWIMSLIEKGDFDAAERILTTAREESGDSRLFAELETNIGEQRSAIPNGVESPSYSSRKRD
jgi:tetratricopeptide (TPR) repeat protein